ncbi:MAG: hypothetical protein ACOZAR_02750 [Patescibacteria group bacterium]
MGTSMILCFSSTHIADERPVPTCHGVAMRLAIGGRATEDLRQSWVYPKTRPFFGPITMFFVPKRAFYEQEQLPQEKDEKKTGFPSIF